MSAGKLYIVATPIGNLGDITLRALEILKQVHLIASEDTRTTRKLLAHFDINTSLCSYFDSVERRKAENIIDAIEAGKDVALVSECGTPLISDPGYQLVQHAIERNIDIIPLPGASAAVTALTVSGLAVDAFVFEGYLSRSPSKRRKRLRELVDEERTMIFYESPHRLLKMLRDVETVLGNRRVAVVRELTKKFEETVRMLVHEAIDYFESKGVKGEFVVVVEGKSKEKG